VRRAFSLIELMIVIMIIGVVYTLAITKLKSVGDAQITPNFLHLKEYLLEIGKGAKEVTFICLDDCSSCTIYGDGERLKEVESWFDDSVRRYYYDVLAGAMLVKERVFFNEEGVQESVCFSFSVARSGISDQVIVLYKDRAYDYTSYFDTTKVYNSLSESIDEKQNLMQEVQ